MSKFAYQTIHTQVMLAKLISPLLAIMICTAEMTAQETIQLTNWQYSKHGTNEWRTAKVPGLIQEQLIDEGRLPNPQYRLNERLIQGIEEENWLYKAEFAIPEVRSLNKHEAFILDLDGIDTYSDILINGKKVGETENMFLAYRFDISPYIHRGKNTLTIHLKSPIRMARPLQERAGFNYPADNDHATIRYSPFTRKAPYHYGWDWGMRMLTMGIWQPLRLTYYQDSRHILQDLSIESKINWQGKEALSAELSISPIFTQGRLDCEFELISPKGTIVSHETIKAQDSIFRCTIQTPELWQPRGWGEASLYTLRIKTKGKNPQSIERRFGIRELRLVHKPKQEVGKSSFYFEVNKQAIYTLGANYIPGENILTKRTDAYFRQLFDDIEFAGMNMIRVWGGGIYEDERFYAEADRRGILIWQDFMFACTAYPADKAFLHNIHREAEYQIKRLRHHPSIALWCGNNEVEEAIKYWGWQKKFSPEHYAQMRDDYDPIFRQLLPQAVSQYDPNRQYIHSSPTSANWGRKETWLDGDSHYWGLWYGEEDFDTFDEKLFSFVSEFGFQSFPDVPSLRQFAEETDMSLESEVMKLHQKASTGNRLIKVYMERMYKVPSKFEDFVYTGLVMQARGMEHSVRALRRHKPTCMGALVWQLNDAWAAVSWSSIDYYQNYKPLHFRLRKAFAPVTLLPYSKDDSLSIHVTNDRPLPLQDIELHIELRSFDGKTIKSTIVPRVTIESNQTQLIAELPLPQESKRQDTYYDLHLYHRGQVICEYKHYLHKPKELNLPKASYTTRWEQDTDGSARLHVKANSFVKDLWLSNRQVMGIRYSDNLIDLAPGEEISIQVTQLPETYQFNAKDFYLRTLN